MKKKASEINKWQSQTGGGPKLDKKLTELELRVLNIIGTISFEGCGTKEVGVSKYEHLKVVDNVLLMKDIFALCIINTVY